MTEQAAHLVQKPVKALPAAFSRSRDTISAYDRLEAERDNNKKSNLSHTTSSFKIEKHFSASSKELARTMSKFNTVLEFLEGKQTLSEPQINTANHSTIGPKDGDIPISVPQISSQNSHAETAEQLEFEFSTADNETNQSESKPPLEIKKFDVEIATKINIDEEPDINLGNNPTDFKIQNLITDEIIKAISNSNRNIEIKQIDEPIAAKLANQVRKLLATQPHALASTEETTPIKTLDKNI